MKKPITQTKELSGITGPFNYGEIETRVLKVVVLPLNEPLFSKRATEIEITDAAGGEYVIIRQDDIEGEERQKVAFDKLEWPAIRNAIDLMIGMCRDHN